MDNVPQGAQGSEPFRWKLFVLVMIVMGAIAAAAIVLTLKAHPRRGTVRVPPPQPVSRFHPFAIGHQSSSSSFRV